MDGASMGATDATPMGPAAIAMAGATVATGTARASMAIGIAAVTATVVAGRNHMPNEAVVSAPSGPRIAVASSATATVMLTATVLSRRLVRSSPGQRRWARPRRTDALSAQTAAAAAAAAVVADVAAVVEGVKEPHQRVRPI